MGWIWLASTFDLIRETDWDRGTSFLSPQPHIKFETYKVGEKNMVLPLMIIFLVFCALIVSTKNNKSFNFPKIILIY